MAPFSDAAALRVSSDLATLRSRNEDVACLSDAQVLCVYDCNLCEQHCLPRILKDTEHDAQSLRDRSNPDDRYIVLLHVPPDFAYYENRSRGTSLDYARTTQTIVLRMSPSLQHGAFASELVANISPQINQAVDAMTRHTTQRPLVMGVSQYTCLLPDGREKQADNAWVVRLQPDVYRPFCILEVGVSESAAKLTTDAERWLALPDPLAVLTMKVAVAKREASLSVWQRDAAGTAAEVQSMTMWLEGQSVRSDGETIMVPVLLPSSLQRPMVVSLRPVMFRNYMAQLFADDPQGHDA
ncbi:hypothetical protein KEM52_004937 [Ascosphaera acerosa]|nr:hypothetical protein KEM52_004937 [Ascosphaera acerosa]